MLAFIVLCCACDASSFVAAINLFRLFTLVSSLFRRVCIIFFLCFALFVMVVPPKAVGDTEEEEEDKAQQKQSVIIIALKLRRKPNWNAKEKYKPTPNLKRFAYPADPLKSQGESQLRF